MVKSNKYADDKKVLLSVRNLKKYFPVSKKSILQRENLYVHANENITLDIYEGETFGLVGESGCGKSTFGRTLIQLYEQTEGSTLFYGETIAEMAPKYVSTVIKNIEKLFPEYQKAEQELAQLKSEAKTKTGIERAALDEKVMVKNREIENKYLNLARIAGGLLTHADLNKVSSELMNSFNRRVEIAKIRRELVSLETEKTDKSYTSSEQKTKEADQKIADLKKQIAEQEKIADQEDLKVEALRNECRHNPEFDKYENLRDNGVDLSLLTKEEMRVLRKDMQIIFQDPYSSLDTRMTVGQIIGEGVLAHGIFKNRRVDGYNEYIQDVMEKCGLDPYFIHRYPHQFSGGQRQRIGIARALALNPRFIVCDEAVSALDVSIQSQIINLLQDLAIDNDLTYLFITHDLSVVKYISDRIGVMYLGEIVEMATTDRLFDNPLHPYTSALIEAIPRTDVPGDQELSILEGDIPSAVKPPTGCRFHTRCKYVTERCVNFQPEFKEIEPDHFVACHLMDMSEEEKAEALALNENKHQKQLAELQKIADHEH
ncbi:MAG: oligopeptide/dipeptide ABC transporter ATP-binding protein [Saccharofermentanales bacterium]|jgi:oligopeptide/dipeptide ABC transporter ATP-binding protein